MFSGVIYGQKKPVYVIKARYDQQVNDFINNSAIDFKEIKILVNYQILDAKNRNVVDYKRIDGWISKLFRNKNDSGVLCVDLENRFYEDLKKATSSRRYQIALKEYVKLVKYIKQKRPNVKVGIWGLPFEVSNEKLDPIFEAADVIFPSCYIRYPADVKGIQPNLDFLKSKLDNAFDFADRLNKPVVPFFWYLVHGPDKTLRLERLSREEMLEYIKYAEDYISSKGSGIAGIGWWDTPSPYTRNSIKENFIKKNGNITRALSSYRPLTINEMFLYYFK